MPWLPRALWSTNAAEPMPATVWATPPKQILQPPLAPDWAAWYAGAAAVSRILLVLLMFSAVR